MKILGYCGRFLMPYYQYPEISSNISEYECDVIRLIGWTGEMKLSNTHLKGIIHE